MGSVLEKMLSVERQTVLKNCPLTNLDSAEESFEIMKVCPVLKIRANEGRGQ